jgi:hypothetical protein
MISACAYAQEGLSGRAATHFRSLFPVENKINQTSFKATRAKLAEHSIEQVGSQAARYDGGSNSVRWSIAAGIRLAARPSGLVAASSCRLALEMTE